MAAKSGSDDGLKSPFCSCSLKAVCEHDKPSSRPLSTRCRIVLPFRPAGDLPKLLVIRIYGYRNLCSELLLRALRAASACWSRFLFCSTTTLSRAATSSVLTLSLRCRDRGETLTGKRN